MTSRGGAARRHAKLCGRGSAARPAAERGLRQLPQLGHRNRAGDDKRGIAGNEVLPPECLQVVPRQLLVRLERSSLAESILMRAVQGLAGDDTDDLHRVAPLLGEIGKPRRPNALDFFAWKARTKRDIGDERQRRREIPAEAARRNGRGIPRGAGAERRADLRDFLSQLHRVARRRALIEKRLP